MPEITVYHIATLTVVLLLGVICGWVFRSSRSSREKTAINAGWQAQINSQQTEHDRLAGQNKSLMEQISQYQASNKDSKMRARELSDSLKEAFERRDDLQRQLKEIRSNLEVAVAQRDKLKTNADFVTSRGNATAKALEEKDDKIRRLNKELANWQERVPPLLERYRQRDLEAQQLDVELQTAKERVAMLEGMISSDNTRIEPVDASTLPEGLDASNEPHDSSFVQTITDLQDQIDQAPHEGPEPVAEAKSEAEAEFEAEFEAEAELEDEPEAESEAEPEDEPEDELKAEAELEDEPEAEPEAEPEDEPEAELEAEAELEDEPEDEPEAEAEAEAEAEIGPDGEPGRDPDDTPAQDTRQHLAYNMLDDAAEAAATESDTAYEADELLVPQREEFPNVLNDEYATGIYAQDDLKHIKGVGPAIEKTLNDLGIFRYNQIAEMSEYDIDRVAQQLKGFRSRIYREDWIGQARTLQYQKNND